MIDKDSMIKTGIAGFVVIALITTAAYIGSKKTAPLPKLTAPVPVLPEPEPLEMPKIEPDKEKEKEKTPTASYIRGYQDGYSGAWLSPARWMIKGEYRAGHHAGRQDKEDGKPNKFK